MIRIMTANVLTPNRNVKALIELVRENVPDILVTLESDLWWQAKLDILESDYPYTIKCPLDNLLCLNFFLLSPKFLHKSSIYPDPKFKNLGCGIMAIP
jgi:endonuclease/exonuclease/phosphatase (EEP) superfamily protein YafD